MNNPLSSSRGISGVFILVPCARLFANKIRHNYLPVALVTAWELYKLLDPRYGLPCKSFAKMKRCYGTKAVFSWTALLMCVFLSGAQSSCNQNSIDFGFDYFSLQIASTVTTVHDTEGNTYTLDQANCDYEYKWSASKYCLGSCSGLQESHFTADTTSVTTGTLHSQLTIPTFHLCKPSAYTQPTKLAKIYKSCSGGSSTLAFGTAEFSITVQEVESCQCTNYISNLDLTNAQSLVSTYADDEGVELAITNG